MKTRLCVLGDSHTAALKRAWEAIKSSFTGGELHFFCARADGLSGMQSKGGKLIPDNEVLMRAIAFTSGGRREVDPMQYDAFLIYGLGVIPYIPDDSRVYSRAVVAAAITDGGKSSLGFTLAQRLRTTTDKPIYIGHNPLSATDSTDFSLDDAAYTAWIRLVNTLVYSPLPATLVPQPTSTVVAGRYTDGRYSWKSRRLAVGDDLDDELHSSEDDVHMNAEYGRLWLREFLKATRLFHPEEALRGD